MQGFAAITALLGILASVTGFYFSNVVSEIRGRASLVYDLNHGWNSVSLTVSNISAAHTIPSSTFALVCRTTKNEVPENCFGDHELTIAPPVLIDGLQKAAQEDTQINYTTELPPGASFRVIAELDGGEEQSFYFLFSPADTDAATAAEDSNEDSSVTLLSANAVSSLFLRNYFAAMSLAIVISLFAALVLLGALFYSAFGGGGTKNVDDASRSRRRALAVLASKSRRR